MIDGGKTNVLGQMDSLTETSLSGKRTKIGTFIQSSLASKISLYSFDSRYGRGLVLDPNPTPLRSTQNLVGRRGRVVVQNKVSSLYGSK